MLKRYLTMLFFVICDIILADAALGITLLTVDTNALLKHELLFVNFILWPAILVLVFYIFKIYNILWRYSNLSEPLRIALSSGISSVILIIAQTAIFKGGRLYLSQCILLFLLSATFVIIQRMLFKKIAVTRSEAIKAEKATTSKNDFSGNIMLIGAGNAGQMLMNEFSRKWKYRNCKIKCAIDDDSYKHGQYISGIKIIGGRDVIVEAAKKFNISTIVFAIPNCPSDEKAEILNMVGGVKKWIK